MKNAARPPQRNANKKKAVLYMAFEMSDAKWKLAFSDRKQVGIVTIGSKNLMQLQEAIHKAKFHFSLNNPIRIVSCCEAGLDGFWLHANLLRYGIRNIVVDLSNKKMSLQGQRARTVRLDAIGLLRMLIRYDGGEKNLLSVVRTPGIQDKDTSNPNRNLETLKKRQTGRHNAGRGFYMIQKRIEELFGVKQIGFVTMIVLLLFASGYLLMNINSHDSPRWGIEDLAPQKYESSILKAKESFVPGFTDEMEQLPIVEKYGNQMSSAEGIQDADQITGADQKDDDSEKQADEPLSD